MNATRRVLYGLRQQLKYAVYLCRILWKHRQHANVKYCQGRLLAEVKAHGLRLLVHPLDNGVAKPLYTGQVYEEDETTFLSQALRPGMVFVDIGANVGYFTTLASVLVGETGIVLAVEPDPRNYELLKLNVERNHLQNVVSLNCALGSFPGTATLFRSSWNFGDHRLISDHANDQETVPVQVHTLDHILHSRQIPRVNLIKIDVQGFELKVQEGMASTLDAASPPTVLTELWPYGLARAGGSAQQYFKEYTRRGYQAHKLTTAGLQQPVSWEELEGQLPKVDPRYPEAAYLNLVFSKEPSGETSQSDP
jgi:FkbM family methyltransferase